MKHALTLFLVFLPLAFAFVVHGTGCVSPVDSDGSISGLSGGEPLDADLAQQNPALVPTGTVACSDAGLPGGNCVDAGDCCGIAAPASEICFYDGMSSGTCQTEPEAGTGSTWTELYADYFGGHGRASCAGNGMCHGSVSQLGYMYEGYLCPPDDATACYMGMKNDGFLLPGPFNMTLLYYGLRSVEFAGAMPKAPEVYQFS